MNSQLKIYLCHYSNVPLSSRRGLYMVCSTPLRLIYNVHIMDVIIRSVQGMLNGLYKRTQAYLVAHGASMWYTNMWTWRGWCSSTWAITNITRMWLSYYRSMRNQKTTQRVNSMDSLCGCILHNIWMVYWRWRRKAREGNMWAGYYSNCPCSILGHTSTNALEGSNVKVIDMMP